MAGFEIIIINACSNDHNLFPFPCCRFRLMRSIPLWSCYITRQHFIDCRIYFFFYSQWLKHLKAAKFWHRDTLIELCLHLSKCSFVWFTCVWKAHGFTEMFLTIFLFPVTSPSYYKSHVYTQSFEECLVIQLEGAWVNEIISVYKVGRLGKCTFACRCCLYLC